MVNSSVPLAEMFGYATTLRSLSSGRAAYSMHFEKYTKAPNDLTDKILEEIQKAKELDSIESATNPERVSQLSQQRPPLFPAHHQIPFLTDGNNVGSVCGINLAALKRFINSWLTLSSR